MKKITCLFCLVALLVSACATHKIAVQRMAPAKYEIEGMNKIGVMNFSSEDPAYTNGAMAVTTIVENKLIASNFYKVAPRVNKYQGLPVQTSPVILPELIIKIGKEAGVDLLVFGLVDIYDSKTTTGTKRIEKDVEYTENGVKKTKKEVTYKPWANRKAALSFKLYALRTDNGKYAGKSTIEDLRNLYAEGDSDINSLPSEQYLLSELTERLTDRAVSFLVPHEVTEQIKILKSKSCNEGFKMAKSGNWDGAVESWEKALTQDPNDHVALYNLGVASEYQRNYSSAREYYKNAMRIANKPLYNEAWVRVHDIVQQNEKLERQINKK